MGGALALLLVGGGVYYLWQWYKRPTSQPEQGQGQLDQEGTPDHGRPDQNPDQAQDRSNQRNPHPENTGHDSRTDADSKSKEKGSWTPWVIGGILLAAVIGGLIYYFLFHGKS